MAACAPGPESCQPRASFCFTYERARGGPWLGREHCEDDETSCRTERARISAGVGSARYRAITDCTLMPLWSEGGELTPLDGWPTSCACEVAAEACEAAPRCAPGSCDAGAERCVTVPASPEPEPAGTLDPIFCARLQIRRAVPCMCPPCPRPVPVRETVCTVSPDDCDAQARQARRILEACHAVAR